MKRIAFFVCLLAVCAAAARAQESRQDISLSGTAFIEPYKASSTDVQVHSTTAYGGLISYRFMLTPCSALEANYGITYQNKITYVGPQFQNGIGILTRTQEISGAYVRSFVFKNFNPFVEGGPAGIIFLPIYNSGTKTLDAHQQTEIGGMYGAGFAYEVSPSFDHPRRVSCPGHQGADLRRRNEHLQLHHQSLVQHYCSYRRRSLPLLIQFTGQQSTHKRGPAMADPLFSV